jgi:hypothetical protein
LSNTLEASPPVADRRTGARNWAQILLRYRQPSGTRSVVELIITGVPFILIWAAMWAALDFGF